MTEGTAKLIVVSGAIFNEQQIRVKALAVKLVSFYVFLWHFGRTPNCLFLAEDGRAHL